MQNQFKHWIKTPKGKVFLETEIAKLASVYPLLSGAQGLQVALSDTHDYLREANVSERYYLLASANEDSNEELNANTEDLLLCKAIVNTGELPFANNQFGVVMAPHILEVNESPQAALREIYRVTAPDGTVLITGINPVSLLNLRSKLSFSKNSLRQSFVGISRLKDWLQLLGFDIVAGNMFQYSGLLLSDIDEANQAPLKCNARALTQRVHTVIESIGDRWLPMSAGAYVIVAKKRVLGGTMVGKVKRKRAGKLVAAKPIATSRVNTNKHAEYK